MFRNYLKTALRNIRSNKIYTIINIIGFAVGLASCLLIMLYVYNEISFERHHKNRDNIYRVAMHLKHGEDNHISFAAAMTPLAPALKAAYPEIKDYVRIRQTQENTVEYKNMSFIESGLVYAESSFFRLFSYNLHYGNDESALEEPFSVILSPKTAEKFFGEKNPLGEKLLINESEYTVTGVLDKFKGNSQLNFNFIASYTTLKSLGQYSDNWIQMGTDQNFILLDDKTSGTELGKKLQDVITQNINPPFSQMITLELQPMKDIYFKSKMNNEFEPSGDLKQVYTFSTIAGLLMLIACLNFINLSTARSLHRTKEVGMRKIFGSQRSALIMQFLVESVLITVISMSGGLLVFRFLYPALSNYIGRQLAINYLTNPLTLIVLLLLAVVIGILAGLYPAFYLSKFKPLDTLQSGKGKKRVVFRTIMVIFQFSIAIVLIFSTIIVYKQLYFLRNSDQGFDKKDILVVHMNDRELSGRYEVLQKEFEQIPLVSEMTVSLSPPGSNIAMFMNTKAENASEEEGFMTSTISCDYNYIPFFNLQLIKGRNFSQEFPSDTEQAVIINEAAVKKLGFTDPLGQKIIVPTGNRETIAAEIIGVVKDFHYNSLKSPITPQIFFIRPEHFLSFAFKYPEGKSEALISALESKWKNIIKDIPFEYSFLEDDNNELYKAEEKMGQLFIFFSVLVIFIAGLGIFGLALFTAEQRTKEIGIRKVHGASQTQLVILLINDFAKWVIAANIIALPAGYYLMHKWLNSFAGKTAISFWVYLGSGLIALCIALLTVSFQSYRAAARNPVETLKYE